MANPTDVPFYLRPVIDGLLQTPLAAVSQRPSHRLYHYTSADGLLGIFNGSSLWASDLRYLNDSRELAHGLDLIREAIAPWLEDVGSGISATLLDVFGFNPWGHGQPFAASLSEDPDKLSQWRAYASRGGYAIGFTPGAIDRICSENEAVLGRVIYDDEQQREAVHRFVAEVSGQLSIVSRSMQALKDFDDFADYENSEVSESMTEAMHVIKTNTFVLAALMKDSSFSEEREWRLIVLSNKYNELLFRTSASGIVPFVELQIPEKDIKTTTVIVGPCPHPRLAEEVIKLRLAGKGGIFLPNDPSASNDEPDRFRVRHSTIPYRNW